MTGLALLAAGGDLALACWLVPGPVPRRQPGDAAQYTARCPGGPDAGGSAGGPAEATAIGNILVQARALGAAPGDLAGMRALVRGTQPLRRFEPGGDGARWRAAAERLRRAD